MIEKIIKIILAILFFICLADLPYGYYQIVRFAGMLGFALLAYFSYQQNHKIEAIIYIALLLLFQPILKVALGRSIWNIIDVVLGAGLIISLFLKPKKA